VATSAAAPARVSPADAAWPATLPPVPARRGSGDAADLRALAASQDIFTVEARLPVLEGLQPDGLPALQAALEADPRWRVGRWGEDLVAWRRCKAADGTWHASWAGYCTADGAEWRVMLVLTGAPPEDADPLAGGRYKVRAGPSRPDGWRSGTLRAAGPGIWMEIHERGTELDLTHTATALMTLDGELQMMLRKAPPERAGWVWAEAPGQEALTGERIRGAAAPPADLPPGLSPAQAWLQWDGEPAGPLPVDGA
jgi:hypothetical protein